MTQQTVNVRETLTVGNNKFTYYSLKKLESQYPEVAKLPYSMKVLLEAAVRQVDGLGITEDHIKLLAQWASVEERKEVPFIPARILLQDFTGVPVVVDLAAMRSTIARVGGDPKQINPLVPVDLVIDHSVMVDSFGTSDSLTQNMDIEFERNEERYKFLRWAQGSFEHFRAVPPAMGIVHQVNLEYLASVAATKEKNGEVEVYPDSLVGTDSHTTMINGLGVVGWGVGGIEAEAGMLGQPLYFILPEVVGFKLTGELPEGATATDLALTITQILRQKGVVGKFVEYYGDGLSQMTLADRATVANMAPEYGATVGFFPVDKETLNYLRGTGREEEHVALVEQYYKAQGMFHSADAPEPQFSETLELDLSTVVPSLAGPKRPQDRISLDHMKKAYNEIIRTPIDKGGYGLNDAKIAEEIELNHPNGEATKLKAGSVVIAAITSCTNTSNPSVMLGAGLLAKKAVEKGLRRPAYVKTSLTPGSKVVSDYLQEAGVLSYLEKLGFYIAGYGCATCIGNSGPLPEEVSKAIIDNDLTVASVLSGNRNFEGRIHAEVKMNYLASPPLVVAYALAGTVDIDLENDPIGYDPNNKPIYLKDIWPSGEEIRAAIRDAMKPELFQRQYAHVFNGNQRWNEIETPESELYSWEGASTYIQEPPFFEGLTPVAQPISEIRGLRTLAMLSDSVTTDHISPAGNIAASSPAGKYLQDNGVDRKDFNSYGSRRGSHDVMMRGTFANVRIRNKMADGKEGGFTKYLPTGEVLSIYDAAMKYKQDGTPLVVLAGKEYGTGSSRDWAAKGTFLLGVKAVIAESFERIHRSNLVGMGVMPLQFPEGFSWKTLGIEGSETFDFVGINDDIQPGQSITVNATRQDGSTFSFDVIARLDSAVDVVYYRNGGILQTVLRQMMNT